MRKFIIGFLSIILIAFFVCFFAFPPKDNPVSFIEEKPHYGSIKINEHQKNNAMLISAKALKFNPNPAKIKMLIIKDIIPRVSSLQKINSISNAYNDFEDNSDLYKEKFVWVLKDDTFFERRILVGLNDNENIQVASGLDSNDIVVTGIADTQK